MLVIQSCNYLFAHAFSPSFGSGYETKILKYVVFYVNFMQALVYLTMILLANICLFHSLS